MNAQSDNTAKISDALAKSRAAFKAIRRDKEVSVRTKTGGTYKFAYAPLEVVIDAVTAALSEHGLSIQQTEGIGDEAGFMVTILRHSSGEWIKSYARIIFHNGNAQEYGSAVTYARRYGLQAMLGITADDDDDSNLACGNNIQVTANKSAPKIEPKMVERLQSLIAESGSDVRKVCTHFKVPSLADMTAPQAQAATAMLKKKISMSEKKEAA